MVAGELLTGQPLAGAAAAHAVAVRRSPAAAERAGTMAPVSPAQQEMSSVTAVLWDIDGTLLTAGRVGVDAFLDAVADVAGSRPSGSGLDLGGRIDPDIAAAMLGSVGAPVALSGAVLDRLAVLATERQDRFHDQTTALPGIPAVLAWLADLGVRQTVVTGNIGAVGRIKLAAAGLVPPIDPALGGFGDDGTSRADVARGAVAKLVADGWDGSPERCWIVGDTPRDAACAAAIGVRCALVATGRHSAESLSTLGADVVVQDFDRADALLRAWGCPDR